MSDTTATLDRRDPDRPDRRKWPRGGRRAEDALRTSTALRDGLKHSEPPALRLRIPESPQPGR
jgi:hypothetical protein